MYPVPATSALVLLFTEPDIYDCQAAKRFLASVDLSAGIPIKAHFKEWWDVAHPALSTRKIRVKQLCHQYLTRHPTAQVVSLGGGLDPLTIDLAECFPEASVFDLDMSQMDVKAEINASVNGPALQFVTANLAEPQTMTHQLQAVGWTRSMPTLVVAEGITYYVPAPVFAEALASVRTYGGALVLEYTLPDDDLTDVNLKGTYVAFFARLTELLQMPFPMVRYSAAYVQQLAERLGGVVVQTIGEHEAELQMKGFNELFHTPDSGGIRVSLITY